MATLSPSAYCYYKFSSPEEERAAQILTSSQRAYIQNLIAACAEEVLNLRYDPQNPFVFVQQDAECKGQLAMLTRLLANSEEAEQELQQQS